MMTCLTSVCEKCRKETDHLSVLVAVAVSGVNKASLYRWMDDKIIHYRQLPTGHRMICLNSLRKIAAIDTRLLAALIRNPQPGKRKPTKRKASQSVSL